MRLEWIEWARARLFARSVFREVFGGDAGAFAMADLRKAAGASGPQVYTDPEGRVFLRIDHPHFEPGCDAELRGQNLGRLQMYERIQRFVRMPENQIVEAEQAAAERINAGGYQ